MFKKRYAIFCSTLFLFTILSSGCKNKHVEKRSYVTVDGSIFRDTVNRMLILRGLNYVNKDQENKHLNLIGDTAFREMKEWGYNSVRLGINWSALEPTPNQYDSVYLKDLDDRISMARRHNLYVILDMHQDLYGEKFGGGAPLWATLDQGLPHITGGTWSDAYYISPAVQASFDSFWENAKVPNGMGLQDHYSKTWKMLAQRYRNDNNIIGFDVMNEPFIGSQVNKVLGIMIQGMTDHLNKNGTKQYNTEEVGAMWVDSQGKELLLKMLQDSYLYVNILHQMEPIYKEFEENKLVAFYQKLAKEIRAVNRQHILFWEPSVSSNNGIPTHIRPIKKAGKQQAYMPHLYDIVLDTDLAGEADGNRLAIMFERMQQSAERLKMPYLIGEWGAFYGGNKEVLAAAKAMAEGIDKHSIGDYYWSYFRGINKLAYFQEVLQRPYLSCTAGKVLLQRNNSDGFEASWEEDESSTAATRIYLPNTINLQIEGVDKKHYKLFPLNQKAAWLEIPPLGEKSKRSIKIYNSL